MAPTTTSTKKYKKWNTTKEKTKDRILEMLGDAYCATPYDIARYIRRRIPTKNDIRSINATLKEIREFDSHRKWIHRDEYLNTHIYGLTDYGARYCTEILGVPAREFEARDYAHEHIITRFHIQLREFATQHGYGLRWRQEAINLKHDINPDAIATLTTPKGSFTFCIEPERQSFTENHLKKAKKYHAVFGTPECTKLFGAEKVRVIFIVLSERKRQTMLEKFAEEYPYRMFWFTTIEAFQNDIGGEIFMTPKDGLAKSYSFLSL